MKIERVVLVNSPIDAEGDRKQAVNDRAFPPLGLLTIASRLKLAFPYIDVKIADGDFLSEEEIHKMVRSFDPQILGISILTPTYKSGIRIATISKQLGVPYVVLGNDHASFFPERIITTHDDVSFVISGDDGEIDFVELVRALGEGQDPFEHVTNLHGRANGRIRSSAAKNYILSDKLSKLEFWPDPKLLDPSLYNTYVENYQTKFGSFHRTKEVKPFVINNAKGCYKEHDRCLYCSIFDLGYQRGNVAVFWSAIERYYREYGINFFFEVCDNFGPLRSYRKELIRFMPSWFDNSEVDLMVYTDASIVCTDQHLIDDLKRLHVLRVNMGLDSGDPTELLILKGFKNGDLNRKAVEKLTSNGIQIHASFVLGALGEDERSLQNTVEFVNELLGNPNVVAIEVSPLFPLPSSPAWDLFLGENMYFRDKSNIYKLLEQARFAEGVESKWTKTRAAFYDNDDINLTLASKLWCDNFTHVGYDTILKTAADLNIKISESGKICGGFA